MNDSTTNPDNPNDATPEADAWSKEASTWDDNPGVVAYADAAWASLQSAVSLRSDSRVLDFGCGTGLLTERIAPHVQDVIAVDASSAMVDVLAAKELPNVRYGSRRWTPETIASDPLAATPFDLVVCSSVCAFLDDYPAAVAMLAARLQAGGYFVQWDWEFDPAAEEPFGLSKDGIASAMQAAGLEVVSVGVGFEIPFGEHMMRPLMGIGRRG